VNNDTGWPADACEALSWPAVAIDLKAMTASAVLFSGRTLLRGFSLQNGNAAQQTFQILDGLDASGARVALFQINAGVDQQGPSSDTGILMTAGIFMVVPAGPLNGVIYHTPLSGVRGEFPRRHHHA
jgi:hypothetical protein